METSEIKKERSTELICRLCFAEREHYQLIFVDDHSSLNEWIENLTTLKIINVPNAPASLCLECENTLQHYESFREMCFTNDRVFKEMFTQDDPRKDHTTVSNNMPEVREVKIDYSENDNDILDTAISQTETAEITIEYPDIKTEAALNSDGNSNDKIRAKLSRETEPVHKLENNESLLKKGNKKKKQFICSFCDKEFTRAKGLTIHIRSHTQERPHKCKDCDKSFITHSSLNRHTLTHSGLKPYICDMCPAKYSQSSHLVYHKRVHTEEYEKGKKQCTICNKFVHKLNLHQTIHNETKRYQCEYCPKSFHQKYNLTKHIRKHTKEKPYVCSHCNKGFTSSAELMIHIRSHTKERPYKCKDCSKSFITIGHLIRHKLTHSDKKSFSCDMCQAHFAQKYHLVRHKRVHTKESQMNPTNMAAEKLQVQQV
ncbi:gastrula zinc finger protein XlCGF52.1-like [Ochlerotatus camptorhynchus]|uniref:gastrula zinc finger protein XlCGF52.1-like n=1 Tax=Ochlerotatus camptorhynchus TaxID=644619 RepID=UPI0031D3F5FD